MSFVIDGWEKCLEEFLRTEGLGQVKEILRESDDALYYAFKVPGADLVGKYANILASILSDPRNSLPRCDDIVAKICKEVYESASESDKNSWVLKTKVRFRIMSLLNVSSLNFKQVPGNSEVGFFISVKGTVVKAVMSKMLEYTKLFSCSKCGQTFYVQADYNQHYRFEKPLECPLKKCANAHFSPVSSETNPDFCRDYQEVKIQEQLSHLSMGSVPRSIWVTLEDDLVNSCKPGDDVTVIGCVERRWQPLGRGIDGRTEITLALRANYVEVSNDKKSAPGVKAKLEEEFKKFWAGHQTNPLLGRRKILESFCPQVYGLYAIKLALAVVLCGGIQRCDASGTKVRGESHMLMVGDPGTGKSHLLRYAAKLSRRSVLTTGIGSSSAGLTVSAVRDSGEWHLEAGALVLADGGVCCIDEFNTIREADRACILEAMEGQSISVAKAGLVCKLHTRCSVIAATNPKGQYDVNQSIVVNSGISSPLMSRFDLVFVLMDTRSEEWDRLVSSYVLNGKEMVAKAFHDSKQLNWSDETLKAYIEICRKFNPTLSEEASKILSTYFQFQRQRECDSMARTTIRLLESAIRLAQGHARLMWHSEVTVMDAVYSVVLLTASNESETALITNTNPIHTLLPDDPLEEYMNQGRVMLDKLGLHSIWAHEEQRIRKKMNHIDKNEEIFADYDLEKGITGMKNETVKTSDLITKVLEKVNTNQFDALTQLPVPCVDNTKKLKRKAEKQLKENKSKKSRSSELKEPKDKNVGQEMDNTGKNKPRASLRDLLKFDDTEDDFSFLDEGTGPLVTSTQIKTPHKFMQSFNKSIISKPTNEESQMKDQRQPNSEKPTAIVEGNKTEETKTDSFPKVSKKTRSLIQSFAAPDPMKKRMPLTQTKSFFEDENLEIPDLDDI